MQDITIVELFNPVYDQDKNVSIYKVIPDNATAIDLSWEIGQITIVIDENYKCQKY